MIGLQVIDQYQMTADMWEERITSWYAEHKEMRRLKSFSIRHPVLCMANTAEGEWNK